ncbi:MAG: glycosyltransferase family 4 protein [Synechococcaceae cyanobacterium SM2_3_1]|nr:glycosyltransferase family 4 protein [Synechococcaceae cyanobacterium SM2_3_1]
MQHSLLINLAFLIRKPTGLATYAQNLIPHLQRLDPTLLVAEPQPQQTCYRLTAEMTAEQGRLGHLRRLVWTQFQLPHIYRQLQGRLLFSPLPEAPVWTGCRFVVTLHDLIPLRFPSLSRALTVYQRYWLPQVLQQAEHILCDSEATAADAKQFFQIPVQKLTPIPLACDHDHFRFLDLSQRPYFLYIGRGDAHKNLVRLIRAFAQLGQSDTELWLAGPEVGSDLNSLIQELQLPQRVKILGYVTYDQLPILLNQAIALVLPSLWEGFGLPVLEAMACGTPVITSHLSSLPEVAGDAALLVDPYRTEEIAAAMQLLLQDPQLPEQLRQKGLARSAQFTWAKTGAATCEVLERFL